MAPGRGQASLLPDLAAYFRALQSQAWGGSTDGSDWLDGLLGGLANGRPQAPKHDLLSHRAVDAAMAGRNA
jgi:hypothetical protein